MEGTILIADDDGAVRKVLSRAFAGAGCRVHTTAHLATLTRWVADGMGDVAITDVAMPDGNGIERLGELRRIRPELPVIVISAQNSILTAIRAEKAKAYAYFPKPFDLPQVLAKVGVVLRHRSRAEAAGMQAGVDEELPLVGTSPVMQEMYQLLAKSMNSDLSLHFTGETGTGKSLIANVLHEMGDKRDMPFLVIGPDQLRDFESTCAMLQQAGGGSVLIDEVAELPADSQRILVRALDCVKATPPRLLSSSQWDLAAKMDAGEFRSDLYFRLCGITIAVPPLRNRRQDIPLLVNSFIGRVGCNGDRSSPLPSHMPESIFEYGWPGNVRELKNIVMRTIIRVPKPTVSWDEISAELIQHRMSMRATDILPGRIFDAQLRNGLRGYFARYSAGLPPQGIYSRAIREVEAPLIEMALASVDGNFSRCAALLGINRNTLRKKIRLLEADRNDAE
ncbi:MAG: sigma-54 dependent transcriptional regulator [Rhodobacteraceae bacterium]|nr:sigma-54 dependent transcriptional regulator [Paracoccaceae bacterium]